MMLKINVKLLLNFFCAASLSIMVIILSVKFTSVFKSIYYVSINSLKINNYTSLSKAEIKKGYSYIVDFLSDNKSDFSIPYFKSSFNGKAHFYEVKLIFKKLDIIFYLLYGTVLSICILQYKSIDIYLFKYSSAILFSEAVCLISVFAINFDNFFTLFHKVLFNNDNWLFSPQEDPIINILPQKFFLLCAVFILYLMMFTCITFYTIYRTHNKSR